jgi:hypothetical protein
MQIETGGVIQHRMLGNRHDDLLWVEEHGRGQETVAIWFIFIHNRGNMVIFE